jgi:hypothetical protein
MSGADGSYRLHLHGVACWSQVAPPAGYASSNAGVGSTARLQPIDVSDVVSAQRTVLGSLSPVTAGGDLSIGDLVWSDTDHDGRRGANEPGMAGVELTLFDQSNRVLAHTSSGADGHYLFDRLAPGSYRVGVSNLPPSMTISGLGGGGDSLDTQVEAQVVAITGQTSPVHLAVGGQRATVDIGISQAPTIQGLGSKVDVPVLPAPETDQLALAQHHRSMLALLVVGIASLLAGSVLLGLAWPQRRLIVTRTH